jgi:hypothetical protein
LRVITLAAALECEGAKALTNEVLDAAEEIYRFLKGQRDDAAGGGTAHGRFACFARPNPSGWRAVLPARD